ncbi:MAG: HNH endonuclease family protein [Nannocystaceae bacterium]
MAAFVRFSPEEFIRLTRYVYALSVRYNVVCHLSPSEQEHAYNQISVNIFKDTFKRASHVKNSPQFRKLYPDDETFGRAFEFLTMPSRRSSKKIRLLLGEIEAKLGATSESSRTVLEHVCPYHPNERWQQAFGGGVHEVQDRLGNMVILERDDLKQAAFADKRVKYEASGRPLAKKVASYSQWDRTALQEYQAWLAEQAIETWRVGFE